LNPSGGPPVQPPASGRNAVIGPRRLGRQVLYRIVRGPVPEVSDFHSDSRAGQVQTPIQRKYPELFHSLSMWDNARHAVSRANFAAGERVARLVIPAGMASNEIAIHPTPATPHHVDVWGTAEALLTCKYDILQEGRRRR